MRLSRILHKLINEGRKGKSDGSESKGVLLTDKQLCDLWSKACDLEATLLNYQEEVKKIAKKDFGDMLSE